MQSVDTQIQTKQVQAAYDDSYQGETNNNAFIELSPTFSTSGDSPLCFYRQAILLLSGISTAITWKVSP